MNQKNADNRIVWLDILRTIAIVCVVVCHVSERFYFLEGNIAELSLPEQVIGFSIFSLGRVGGVPLFLLITGYLFLQRDYDNAGIGRFYKRNLLPLFLATEIWLVIYHFYKILFFHTPFSVKELAKSMLFFQDADGYLWYLPLIIGIYVFIPFIAIGLQKIDSKWFILPMVLVAFYLFVCPFLGGMRDVKLSLAFSGGTYGLYVIIGGLFAKGIFANMKKMYWCIGAVFSFAFTVLYQLYILYTGEVYPVWYDFAFLLLCGICIFGALRGTFEDSKQKGVWKMISESSFGMYLVHMIWIYAFMRYLPLEGIAEPVCVLIVVVSALLGSFVSVKVLSLIPAIAKGLFLIKR